MHQDPAPVRVKVTRPGGIGLRLRHYGVDEVVSVSAEDAIELHRSGVCDVLEPHRLELPERCAPPAPPEPMADQPRLPAKLTKDVFFGSNTYSAGSEVTAPEQAVCNWVFLGAAKLPKAVELSRRGKDYLRNLNSGVSSPTY